VINVGKLGPMTVETVQGESIVIGEKEITPVARVISYIKRGGTIGEGVSGGGGGFVVIKPLAVLETTSRGTRRISIPDVTTRAMTGMLLAGLALTIICWLVSKSRRVRQAF
jgi:uncharacterized spore protein YtfJ